MSSKHGWWWKKEPKYSLAYLRAWRGFPEQRRVHLHKTDLKGAHEHQESLNTELVTLLSNPLVIHLYLTHDK